MAWLFTIQAITISGISSKSSHQMPGMKRVVPPDTWKNDEDIRLFDYYVSMPCQPKSWILQNFQILFKTKRGPSKICHIKPNAAQSLRYRLNWGWSLGYLLGKMVNFGRHVCSFSSRSYGTAEITSSYHPDCQRPPAHPYRIWLLPSPHQ